MFTINIYLRFALIGLLLIGGTILAFFTGFWYAFPILLIGLGLVISYILLGTIQSAAKFMQDSDFDNVEKRLKLTLKPNWLYSTNRAYFYMMQGSLAQFKRQPEEAEKWFHKAESVKLPTDNEKAMIQLQLANLAAQKEKWNQARVHFRNAKQLKITDENLKDQLRQFEKALSNRGQIKAARQGGRGGAAMRPGGKRRRPKMR
jgi:tetratricopeptide (TPR) repeat protein